MEKPQEITLGIIIKKEVSCNWFIKNITIKTLLTQEDLLFGQDTNINYKRGWDIRIEITSHMSIRKTGIALWRGSGFSLRTLKKENDVFCPSLFYNSISISSSHSPVTKFNAYSSSGNLK